MEFGLLFLNILRDGNFSRIENGVFGILEGEKVGEIS